MKKNKSKYYNKIFYSFVAIFAVLTLIIELLVCNNLVAAKNSGTIKKDTFFEKNYTLMENRILSVFHVIELFSENEDVKKYAEEQYTGYNDIDFYSLIKISNVIGNYMTPYNEYDCKLCFSRLTDNIMVDGGNTVSAEKYLQTKSITPDELKAFFEDGVQERDGHIVRIPDSASNRYVSFIYRYVYPSGKSIYFFIDFDKNYFLPAAAVNEEEFFAVVDRRSRGFCINRSSEESEMLSVMNGIRDSIDDYTETDNRGNGVFTKKSGVASGLLYVYYNKSDLMNLSFFTLVLILLLLWVLLMLAGIIISRYIARKLYGPVSKISGIIADEDDEGEHDDDISFLESSVINLVDNNKKLQEYAEKNKTFLKNGFIKDALTGSVSQGQIRASLETHGLEYLDKPCLCAVCEYDNIDGGSSAVNYRKTQMIKNAFLGIAENYFKGNVSCEIISLDRNRFAIITNADTPVILSEALTDLSEEAKERYNISLISAIGKTVGSIYHIYDSYMSALNLLEYKVALGNKAIIRTEDLKQLNRASYYYPIEIEKNLIYNILEGNKEKCGEIITNILSVNFEDLSLDKQNIKDLKFVLTSTIKRILKQINKSSEEIFGNDLVIYLEINGAEGKDELENVIRSIIDKLTDYIIVNSKVKKNELTKSIIEYIENNYNRDISLQDVAEYFGLSQGHVGRLLKRDMNTSFKQYLNCYRIEVAKKLLSGEDNISVAEVSSMVGCNNTMTFIRMFKRYTGMSPGDYKKAQR